MIGRPLPPCPTSALPGSAEKLAVMRARWEAGYAIRHPGDAAEDERPNGVAVDWVNRNDVRMIVRRMVWR